MLGRWIDVPATVSLMSALERGMEDMLELPGPAGASRLAATLRDEGEALVLRADLPGVADGEVGLSLEGEVLTLQAERKPEARERFRLVRSERPAVRFGRSFTLPCRVDGDATTASVHDGVLTVTMPKARDARPRRIAVNRAS